MINVGCDAWHYFPISEETIKLKIISIKDYFYKDDNVFPCELKSNKKI
jgi:hypothetical protein